MEGIIECETQRQTRLCDSLRNGAAVYWTDERAFETLKTALGDAFELGTNPDSPRARG